ncbi:ethylbenzene dehydrogenase-related protein [Flavihumibacter profundi]|jgi:hypothetical protein|uniref:ethylbenzene dehydrogenase-related protein n=1 Tax=Flavihumibacter profundi TaxID=2716883 RepID=UPI001CC6983F|nr:ethylbenzene dehydrogenase-related protein [Flavihumibacter profundi]MBZ5857222.1 ethylbenzene dehydrogenase-related protein [Flavihumibacter profundi]
MKLFKKSYALVALMSASVLTLTYCTKDNQVLTTTPTTNSSTDLVALLTTTPPAIDGTIDAIWENATKLTGQTEVPNPGNGLFAGYIGDKYTYTLRAMYDAQYIYFLAEWNDPTQGTAVQPWYFDPAKKRWAQEANSRQFDVNGVLTREGIGQDQLAMLWDIDNSTPKFTGQTCYASCHLFNSYRNYAGVMVANKSGNHYTNGANEKIDMWWLHLQKDLLTNQMDDQYQDWAGGPATTDTVGGAGNGRHADDLVPPTPYSTSYKNNNTDPSNGPINNRVSLKLDGDGASVNVPAWIIPDATNKAYYDVADTLPGGAARKVTGVSSDGVLTYDGGTLDPSTDGEYLQKPGVNGGVGTKCIPSFIAVQYTAGRADFTAKGTHTGSGWVVEFKRLLNTNSSLKQDINFESLQDQPFGMAIFNNSNNQHSIKPNLVLKFKKD